MLVSGDDGAMKLRRGRMEASRQTAGRACDCKEAREGGSFLEGEWERSRVCVILRGD